MAIKWDEKNTTHGAPNTPEQRGFAGELVPAAFSVGGGILGGIGGAVGGPIGVAAGGVAGATAGGALGETIQQGIEKRYGQREDIDAGQIAASGVIAGGLQIAGGIFTKLATPVFQASKPVFVKFMSKISGYSDDVLEKALQRTPGAIEGVKGGNQALVDVVKKTAAGIQKYAQTTVSEAKTKIAEFSKQSVTGALPGTKQNLLRDSQKYIPKVVSSLRTDFNIGVDKTGQLIFDRAKNISNIVSGGDRSAIQSAFDSIKTIAKNPDIRNIDSVLERLITLRSKTPVGAPTGAETRAIISRMSDSVVDFVKSVPPGYGKGYAKYAQFLEENLPKRIMINDAKELFGSSANISPKEIDLIGGRLLQLFNTGKLATQQFAEKVGEKVGEDIVGTAAGTLLKTGGQLSVRAKNLTTRGVAEKIIEVVPREVVKNYVETGKIMGEMSVVVKTLAGILGVTEKVILQDVVNLFTNKRKE